MSSLADLMPAESQAVDAILGDHLVVPGETPPLLEAWQSDILPWLTVPDAVSLVPGSDFVLQGALWVPPAAGGVLGLVLRSVHRVPGRAQC